MKIKNYTQALFANILIGLLFITVAHAAELTELSVYLVLADEPHSDSSNIVSEMLSAKFTECADCPAVEVRDSSGRAASVHTERQPRIRISVDDIQAFELAEVRSILDPNDSYWIAVISPAGSAGEELKKLSGEYPLDRVMVANGQFNAVSMLRGPGTRIIEIASFREKSELEVFAAQLSKQIGKAAKWIPFDEGQYQRDRERFLQASDVESGTH